MTETDTIKIVCTNDQLFPLRDTDAEQILSAMSALGGLPGAEVTLLLPARWGGEEVTDERLSEYYEVEKRFSVVTLKSLFPSFRGLEKVGHGVSIALSSTAKEADVLYSRNLPTVMAALGLSDKPVIYETFRPWPDQAPYLRPLLRSMLRHPRFLGAVMHSALAGRSFLDIGLSEERLLVARNGYDPERIQPVLDKEAARKQVGLPRNKPVVAYAGHVSPQKGLGIMLDLAEALPDALFVIIGSYGKGDIETRAELLENVRIVEWQAFSDTVPFLYAADVLFIPPTRSPLEKVGNTVLPIKTFLYMAAGRAIFGPSTPDLLEILEDGKNAALVEPDNPDGTLKALSELLDDPKKMTRLGEQAAQDVAPLTWDNRAARILSFIRDRLSAVRRPRR